ADPVRKLGAILLAVVDGCGGGQQNGQAFAGVKPRLEPFELDNIGLVDILHADARLQLISASVLLIADETRLLDGDACALKADAGEAQVDGQMADEMIGEEDGADRDDAADAPDDATPQPRDALRMPHRHGDLALARSAE